MLSAGFEPAIPASERPQTHALDRRATGIGTYLHTLVKVIQNTAISFCVSWHPEETKLMVNTNVILSNDAWLRYCNDTISSDRTYGWRALQSRVMRKLWGHHIFANRGHYYIFYFSYMPSQERHKSAVQNYWIRTAYMRYSPQDEKQRPDWLMWTGIWYNGIVL
jgi:hypothetical protein